MKNRLAHESSPYLLQHARNPVDWYPWGPEALARAVAEDKPIFLSIGYSACHWCHVMEHESFENPALAAQLNADFVPIKVDREERPDLDHIYMSAVQILTGRGGWPMSVFLTPQLQPFYGGTYFPPHASRGMPGFDQVLTAVLNAWRTRREEVVTAAARLTESVCAGGQLAASEASLDRKLLNGARQALARAFDAHEGGFGSAPKFPHAIDLRLLLRLWRHDRQDATLQMVTLTLDKMAGGGIYDHLAGGFHRYSVDAHWLVPHFEKMLYDNALLTTCYVEAYQATGETRFARVARETADYIIHEMRDSAGGFHSTLDADSEGEEGKYYVWSPAEIEAVLGPQATETFCVVYDVTAGGNFEGKNILNLPRTIAECAARLGRTPEDLEAELARSRAALLAERRKRVPPGLDDKVLVSWNALMIAALAQAGAALDEPRYVSAAAAAADFVLNQMRDEQGRLLHSYRGGQARFAAYLDDYAYFADALVSLYEATFDERYIDAACTLADAMLSRFADHEQGGFYFTADDHESLVARPKDVQDGSTPSATAMAVTALARLGRLCGRSDYLDAADKTLALFADFMGDHPLAAAQMLLALDFHLGPTPELVLTGATNPAALQETLRDVRRRFWPNKLLASRPAAHATPALNALFEGKEIQSPEPLLYVCENFACQEPVRGQAKIHAIFDRLTS